MGLGFRRAPSYAGASQVDNALNKLLCKTSHSGKISSEGCTTIALSSLPSAVSGHFEQTLVSDLGEKTNHACGNSKRHKYGQRSVVYFSISVRQATKSFSCR